MKRIPCLFDEICSYDNLLAAFYNAAKGKRGKKEVIRFSSRLEENIAQLRKSLLSGIPPVGNYHYFEIFDPKRRMICAAAFEERIIHHAIINVCQPVFDRNLIANTFATRKGKGVYQAIDKAMTLMRRCRFVAKLDFKKYYDSIDHLVLKRKLARIFKDHKLLLLLERIIDSYSVTEGKGLPIGNLTSQYFANHYLSDIDHAATEKLHAKGYVRYMDDILLFGDSQPIVKELVKNIDMMANSTALTLKSPIIGKTENGINYLGYRLFPHHFVLAGRSKRRYRQKIRLYTRLFNMGEWSEREYALHLTPLAAFAAHGNNYKFRMTCQSLR
ncbi:MAG: hypothetical protein IJS19_01350 [Muribaculaceae bacterium]|nr:hypothetical protein [Muribaculaceae bacterium]